MANYGNDLELLWEQLLSRDANKVRAAFIKLDSASQQVVKDHLKRMASESDWHPEQRVSAEAALQALTISTSSDKK